ncbi:MAG TPA: hypothetical protein VGR14_14530 [Verrucomicrobiae bacterium]|nr:hypothetical protein [Verrucomicrobiae bacterium]
MPFLVTADVSRRTKNQGASIPDDPPPYGGGYDTVGRDSVEP